jgi:two-component system chemotaxis sensor kinase CheA
MKENEVKNTGHYKIANAGAIALVVFLAIGSVIETVQRGASLGTIVFFTLAALILLISVFRSTQNFSSVAFFAPFIVLLYNTALMFLNRGNYCYFLPACLCVCVMSCLYSNFPVTAGFIVMQAVAGGILYAAGLPVAGPDMPPVPTAVLGFVFLFCCVSLLLLTKTATLDLNKALNEGVSFRTFLGTTANYLAMLDHANKVTYASKSLLRLVGIEYAELINGRSFIDLFPERRLKLLASKMLGQRGFFEDDWEFALDGQKRFFKAASNNLTGTTRGTLINLHDLTSLAERDEIAAMKDSLKIGLFFMDRSFTIQNNYSRFLDDLLSDQNLSGRKFTDLLSASVTPKEMEAIQDYFGMVCDRIFDPLTLKEINPLDELHYISPGAKSPKIFHCEFVAVEQRGAVFILATVYDITVKVELQQRLREEEKRRQEEMRSIFELLQVDTNVFNDFLDDAEYEFTRIDETLKNDAMSTHDVLVEIYQAIHAIKSNAVILGLNTFGEKVHDTETKIKKLREQEAEVPFEDMLHLTVEIEKLIHEKDGFRTNIDKINSFKIGDGVRQNQNQYVLIESLNKTAARAAADMEKKVQFVASDIDTAAVEKGPRRLMKEVLMQLVRNSVAHGIEKPEERVAAGKDETGTIQLSIKTDGKTIHVSLGDNGRGLDFEKIREKAVSLNLIKKEDENNRNVLLQTIFSPGFSTAEAEGLHAGRGIGLNLVRDRVRDGKGTIKLQTEAGKGTVFNLFFPMPGGGAAEQKVPAEAAVT